MVHLLEKHRWLVVVGAFLIQLTLGSIYAWSTAFSPALTDLSGPYGFSATETAAIFSVGIATFTLVMIGAGMLLPIIGPQRLTLNSALVLGASYIAAAYWGNDFLSQLLLIGVFAGAGVGLGYVIPITVGMRWFPDKVGLITGLGVAGFGFGATIWVLLAGSWGGLVDNLSIAGLPGVQSTYLVFGAFFFVLLLLGSLFMHNPRADWQPAHVITNHKSPRPIEAISLTAKEMRSTKQFYGVSSVFLFSALAGLMVISSISLFGIDTLLHNGVSNETAKKVAGAAMASYAIFNGLGRIVWGHLSDRFGRQRMVVIMVTLQGITMLSSYHLFVFFGHQTGLILAAIIIGFNFGGNFALMPAWTADLFGSKHIGSNYPWVFVAYGVAGIVGPLLAGFFKDLVQSSGHVIYWMAPYLIAGVLCFVGAYIASRVKKPTVAETPSGLMRVMA